MTDPTPQTTPTRDEAVPTGWKLVPIRPTLEMQKAYFDEIDRNMSRVETDCTFGRFDNHRVAYAKMLASAPAPASGGVDAVAVKRKLLLEWAEDFDEASKKFERLEKCVLRTRAQECRDLAASLSPAATPVSAAGGERLLRQLRALAVALHAKHYATDAPDWQPLEDGEGILSQIDNMTTGLVRADPVKCNCVRETFAYYLAEAENGLCKIPRRAADDLLQSYVAMEAIVAALAKPAAGGREAIELLSHLKLYVLEKLEPADADMLHDRMHDLTTALSQSTSAGRVGE